MRNLKLEVWAGILAIIAGMLLPLTVNAGLPEDFGGQDGMMSWLDTNHDGRISKAEYAAAGSKMRVWMKSHSGDGPDAPPAEAE